MKRKATWIDMALGCAVALLVALAIDLPTIVVLLIASLGAFFTHSRWKSALATKASLAQESLLPSMTSRAEVIVQLADGVSHTTSPMPVPTVVVDAETTQTHQQSVHLAVSSLEAVSVPAPSFQDSIGPTVRSNADMTQGLGMLELPVTVTAAMSQNIGGSTFRIPAPPAHFGEAKWIPESETVTVAGVTLPGGLLYVGTKLVSSRRQVDPCLIDPSLPVAERGNYSLRQMDYWPGYSTISPEARRAYLNWLAGGRKDSDADIGYVFLFFYGLERRVLVDSAKNTELRAEWPAIRSELLRLIAIYGDTSYSFRTYAMSLLAWLSLASVREKTYLKTVLHYERRGELPFAIRLALGQATLDKAPVPSALALAWTKLHPSSNFRTPAIRCKDEFDELFGHAYQRKYGDGLVIAKNRTKLKLVHQPASSAFNGEFQSVSLGDIPDVSVLTAPIKKLQDLAEEVTKELDSYSRFLSRNPEKRTTLEGVLLLPTLLWPQQVLQSLQALRARVGQESVVLTFEELAKNLGALSALSKEQASSLARALESLDMGVEPDVLGGARCPKEEDKVVLFSLQGREATPRSTSVYQASLLTLQLASTVANADGDFSDHEYEYLKAQVVQWVHLAPDHIPRLVAHLQLLRVAPMSLTALRSKLDAFDSTAKAAVASFLATVAQADGMVSPEEVKFLEKVYKALGVDTTKVFSDVHAATATTHSAAVSLTGRKVESTGFKLDSERIATLQKDTAAVTAMLAEIFNEDEAPSDQPAVEESVVKPKTEGLLGLDEVHSTMARTLMSRAVWSRAELGDVAADLDLMLDGALETLNEAAFDAHDIAFIEGDDSITVNPELLEKLAA
jgi:uncharacterized tellurite resistance protein B-like protein